MKIAIDVSPIKNENKNRGVGHYTRSLIEALPKYEPGHTYVFFSEGKVDLSSIDLVHYPYFDPFFLTLPYLKPKPVVATVHDLIPLAMPEFFPRGIKGELKWQIQRRSLAGCRRILTDSQASKADTISLAGIKESKIDVVYLAPREALLRRKKANLGGIVKKFGLSERFILYVGDLNPNKNIIGLLQAFAYLHSMQTQGLTLVLVGEPFLNDRLKESREIGRAITELGLDKYVQRIGLVAGEELVALYKLAAIYVQPSIMEGFGLPVLEAMAVGTMVVTSDRSSLKEIAGPAILVDPYNYKNIGDGILRGLRTDRREWSLKAKKWVDQFSWRLVASQTLATYQKAFMTKE